jgi:K+-transporting ATPase A subunit
MTISGWVQIALFGVIVILITRPLGGYMTRVFSGERTLLSPVLRPVERAVYWCCGVNEMYFCHAADAFMPCSWSARCKKLGGEIACFLNASG